MLNHKISGWQFDRVMVSAATFAILEVTDGLMTVWATNHGFKEVNSLTAPIAASWAFPVIKIMLALLAIIILAPFVKQFHRSVNIGFNCTSAFLIVILASNALEIIKR